MIDREMAEEAIETISVAIAAIVEDAHELAVSRRGSLAEYAMAAAELGAAGLDVATLAAAMKIFVRRADAAE